MKINLSPLATTTPRIRKYIWEQVNIHKRTQKSLAEELHISTSTIFHWCHRKKDDSFLDGSHAKHNLNIQLNQREEAVIRMCREDMGLSIRDICSILHRVFDEDNVRKNRDIKYSRNSIWFSIRRNNLMTPLQLYEIMKEDIEEHCKNNNDNGDGNGNNKYNNKGNGKGNFPKEERPGFLHIDFKFLPKIKELNPEYKDSNEKELMESKLKGISKYKKDKSYMFSAIDRYSRYVYTEILEDKSVNSVSEFLKRCIKDFEEKTYSEKLNKSEKIRVILTDNGFEFTDRCQYSKKKLKDKLNIKHNKPTNTHPFDKVCKEYNIEHRLTKPYHPFTNGAIERFNRRVEECLKARRLFGNEFKSKQEMFDFVIDVTKEYNNHSLQCLQYKTPLEKLKEYLDLINNEVDKKILKNEEKEMKEKDEENNRDKNKNKNKKNEEEVKVKEENREEDKNKNKEVKKGNKDRDKDKDKENNEKEKKQNKEKDEKTIDLNKTHSINYNEDTNIKFRIKEGQNN